MRKALYLFALLTLIACSSDHQLNDRIYNGQVLHIGNGTEPQDLDPHTVTGVPELKLNMALFEGLLARHPESLELIPAIAKSWHHNDSENSYTFHLRNNAKWSNGDPLTANDFVYSWRRLMHPLLGNEYATNNYAIVNAEAYHKNEIIDFEQVGIKALNDYTLEFVLREKNPMFLQAMADRSTFPVHQATIEAHGKMTDRGTRWTRPENIVSNGPFKLLKWEPNNIITMVKNPNYWDRDKVLLNAMHFYPIENLSTEERMFRTGRLQLTTTGYIPTDKIKIYQEEYPDKITITPIYATYFYLINTEKKPFDDVRIRKALALSIDRQSIVDNVIKGGQKPAYSLNPPDPNGYLPASGVGYDTEKAKQLLAEAGYPNGEGFPSFEILYNTVEHHRKIALTIQQMWKNTLGIDATLTNQEWKVYLNTRKEKQYSIARAGSVGSFNDPVDFLDTYTSESGMNDTGWSNSRFDQLINQASQIKNKEERFSLFQEAEKILTDEVPLIPIYYYTKIKLKSPKVMGWHENLLDHPYYKGVYIQTDTNP